MGNVFKKLMRREFGAENYERYYEYIMHGAEKQNMQNPVIYEDMYRFLEDREPQALLFMKSRLDGVILQAFGICRGYNAKLIAALLTAAALLLIQPAQPALGLLLALVGLGLAVKTYEYIVNKYCYVDAAIVLIYKSVLEHLCRSAGTGGNP